MRQPTSAYVSLRQPTSAYVDKSRLHGIFARIAYFKSSQHISKTRATNWARSVLACQPGGQIKSPKNTGNRKNKHNFQKGEATREATAASECSVSPLERQYVYCCARKASKLST